jgi:hypothetical protein
LVISTSSITDAQGNAGTGSNTVKAYFGKRIFGTSSTHDGDFDSGSGGIAGADAFCMADSNKPASGTYKAMLVDGTSRVACTSSFCSSSGVAEHVDWVMAPSTMYVRGDETPVGVTNSAGVFAFPVIASIGDVGFPSGKTWTGMDYDQRNWKYRSGCTCSGWTSTSGNGCYGSNNDSNDNMIDYLYDACSGSYRLFCVEQ